MEYCREVESLGFGGENEVDCCGETSKDFWISVFCSCDFLLMKVNSLLIPRNFFAGLVFFQFDILTVTDCAGLAGVMTVGWL